MAQGSIRKRQLDDGTVRWDVVVDLGADPASGRRRQRKKTYRTRKEAQAGLATILTNIERGVTVDRGTATVADLMAFWLDHYARHHVSARTLDG